MIELSRNITFGQYINNGSALTRMDPRTKLLCAILLIILVSIVSSFTAFAICLLFCVILQRASRISTSYVLGGFKLFMGFLIIIFLVIAFKFVPIFVAEIERLVKAQAARGVRFDQGNFIQRTLKLAPLMIPLFVSGFKRAETLSIAMEARCYGTHKGWRRSKRRALTFTRFDALVLVLTVVVCIVAILVNIFVPF